MTNKDLSAKAMKKVLWETLQKLESNDIDVGTADAIAQQSREIVRVIKTQQSILGQAKENITDELIEYAK